MSDIQDLVSDPAFVAAPPDKQASVLGVFFDKKLDSVPQAKELDPDTLGQTRNAFVQKFLPTGRDTQLGGPSATIGAPRPAPTPAPEPSFLDQASDAIKSIPATAEQAVKKIVAAPAALVAMPALQAQKETKDFTRRGIILEGEGRPRSPLESAAEVGLRAAFLGGVVNRSDQPRSLKNTLLDILDIGAAAGGLAELAPLKAARAAKVLSNVVRVADHLGPEEVKLLGNVTEQLAQNPVAAQVLKASMPAAEAAPAAAPAVAAAAEVPAEIPVIKPALEALEAKGKPFALYVGDQEGVGPMFNIYGDHPTLSNGRFNHSTVSLDTVQKEGIPILGQEARAAGKTPSVPFEVSDTRETPSAGTTPPTPPTPPEIPPTPPPGGGAPPPGAGTPPSPPPPEPGDIGNFNTKRFIDPDVQNVLEKTRQETDVQAKIFAQKRGVMTDDMVNDLADKLNLTPDQLRQSAPGTVMNAEGILRANKELEGPAKALAVLAEKRKAALAAGDQVVLSAIRQDQQSLMTPFVDMLVKTNAISSELGRALHAQKIAIGSMSPAMRQLMGDAIEGGMSSMDPGRLDGLLDKIGSLGGDANAIASELSSQIKPTLMNKIVDIATSFKLSSPTTLLRHNLGNALAVITRFGEKGTQGPIDLLRSVATGTPRERFALESGGYLFGLGQGLQDGAKAFTARLLEGFPDLGGIPAEGLAHRTPAIGGTIGQILHAPSKLLEAGDQFFQTILRRGELYSVALRKATKEGLQMADRWNRIQELVANPTDDMLQAAESVAKEYNYKNPLGPATDLLDKMRNTFDGLPKLLIPFFRTPVNVGKFIIQRSPLALTPIPGGRFWGDIAAGGGAAVDAVTRVTLGTAIQATFVDLALKGYITGQGPKNKAERDLLSRQGWQPRSFHIGDKYYSYQLFDPLTFGAAADIAENWMQRKELPAMDLIANSGLAVFKNLLEQPFLKTVGDIFKSIEDTRGAGKFIDYFAGSQVPSLVGLAAKTMDPTVRQPKGIVQSIEARIPGLSQNVPPRMNVFGEPIQREGNFPIMSTSEKHDPLNDELMRLNKAEGFTIGFKPQRIAGRPLDQGDYLRFQQGAGQQMKQRLSDLITSDRYQGLSDAARIRAIKKIEVDATEGVTKQMHVGVELKSLGLPDVPSMDLPDDLKRTLLSRLKIRIDSRPYKDKPDEQRKALLKEKMRDVLLNYQSTGGQ